MTGQGDFLIVGRPCDSNWIVWTGGSDKKWGLFGDETRFLTRQDASEILLTEATINAWETLVDTACYIAEMPYGERIGKVYYRGAVVIADFISGHLNPKERELLALPEGWF